MISRLAIAISIYLVFAACPLWAQKFEKENHNHNKFGSEAFSEVVTFTGPAKMIYLAGIGAEDPEDGFIHYKDDFFKQCLMSWTKIKKLLSAHGATVNDIVKATTYVTDVRYKDEMQKCRKEVFEGSKLPPHTFLNIVALARPSMMIEVDVVAAVPAN